MASPAEPTGPPDDTEVAEDPPPPASGAPMSPRTRHILGVLVGLIGTVLSLRLLLSGSFSLSVETHDDRLAFVGGLLGLAVVLVVGIRLPSAPLAGGAAFGVLGLAAAIRNTSDDPDQLGESILIRAVGRWDIDAVTTLGFELWVTSAAMVGLGALLVGAGLGWVAYRRRGSSQARGSDADTSPDAAAAETAEDAGAGSGRLGPQRGRQRGRRLGRHLVGALAGLAGTAAGGAGLLGGAGKIQETFQRDGSALSAVGWAGVVLGAVALALVAFIGVWTSAGPVLGGLGLFGVGLLGLAGARDTAVQLAEPTTTWSPQTAEYLYSWLLAAIPVSLGLLFVTVGLAFTVARRG